MLSLNVLDLPKNRTQRAVRWDHFLAPKNRCVGWMILDMFFPSGCQNSY